MGFPATIRRDHDANWAIYGITEECQSLRECVSGAGVTALACLRETDPQRISRRASFPPGNLIYPARERARDGAG